MKNFEEQLDILEYKTDDTEKVKLCENLIKEAQRFNDVDLEFRVREIYMKAVTNNNNYDKI